MDDVLAKFREYYKKADLRIAKPEMREFGIGNRKKIDARHLSFKTIDEFRFYLVANTPLFTSHSTAYYRYPDVTPIENKDWIGADLVFDLDLHSEEKYGVYTKLNQVKDDTIRLIEEFLVTDFGIEKNSIMTVFSGNRGYHLHIKNEEFIGLESDERREIVDYIQGTGLNYQNFFTESEIPGLRSKRLYGPKPTEDGYRGRFARNVIRRLNEKPEGIARKFKTDQKQKENFIKGIEEGNWSRTQVIDIVKKLENIASDLPLKSVQTDSGVTQDVKKLIRVPNSIHGETGLIAKVVENIEKFDPLKDALLKTDKDLKIKFIEDVPAIEIGNETYQFRKDDEKEIKDSIAFFFLLKKSAILI